MIVLLLEKVADSGDTTVSPPGHPTCVD